MAKRWKTCVDLRAKLISTKVSASHRKSSQVNASARKPWPNEVASWPKSSTCVNLRLLQGSHLDNFPLKTLKLGWVAFHSLTFQLKLWDYQYNLIKMRNSPQCSHICAIGYGPDLCRILFLTTALTRKRYEHHFDVQMSNQCNDIFAILGKRSCLVFFITFYPLHKRILSRETNLPGNDRQICLAASVLLCQ